ncbi:NAD(P)-dependent oxidoreductase [Chlamydiota bacterium]
MKRIRILNCEPDRYAQEAKKILHSFSDVTELKGTKKTLLREIKHYDGVITRFGYAFDKELLGNALRLKVIGSPTTGLDHIDSEYACNKGVTVVSLKGQYAFLKKLPSTAEHTFALILGLVRNIYPAFEDVKNGKWDRDRFIGTQLYGKTIGIIGCGRIGSMVARMAYAFGMRVIVYDIEKQKRSDFFYPVSLDELLEQADIITVHVPLEKKTTQLIGKDVFNKMKQGVFFINTSRGDVVCEKSLLAALKKGIVKGAALDVLCDELTSGFIEHNNIVSYAKTHNAVLITPHLGGATSEAMAAAEVFIAKKIKDFFIKSNS